MSHEDEVQQIATRRHNSLTALPTGSIKLAKYLLISTVGWQYMTQCQPLRRQKGRGDGDHTYSKLARASGSYVASIA